MIWRASTKTGGIPLSGFVCFQDNRTHRRLPAPDCFSGGLLTVDHGLKIVSPGKAKPAAFNSMCYLWADSEPFSKPHLPTR